MSMLELFRTEVYEPLGEVLEAGGDEGFITKGPELVRAFYTEHKDLLEQLATKHAERGYTRKKVICDDGRHAVRCMEWAPGAVSPVHEHGGRPCFDIVLSGALEIVDYYPEQADSDTYTLEEIRRYSAGVGGFVIVNPFRDESEVHKVVSGGARSKSLHFYPIDHRALGVYEQIDDRHNRYKRVAKSIPDD